jgi:hypothetical protein
MPRPQLSRLPLVRSGALVKQECGDEEQHWFEV